MSRWVEGIGNGGRGCCSFGRSRQTFRLGRVNIRFARRVRNRARADCHISSRLSSTSKPRKPRSWASSREKVSTICVGAKSRRMAEVRASSRFHIRSTNQSIAQAMQWVCRSEKREKSSRGSLTCPFSARLASMVAALGQTYLTHLLSSKELQAFCQQETLWSILDCPQAREKWLANTLQVTRFLKSATLPASNQKNQITLSWSPRKKTQLKNLSYKKATFFCQSSIINHKNKLEVPEILNTYYN